MSVQGLACYGLCVSLGQLSNLSFFLWLFVPPSLIPLWFIPSPPCVSLSLSPLHSLSLKMQRASEQKNRQHQFCQPTKVALASANWTDLLWGSLVADKFCLSGKGTQVCHCQVFITARIPQNSGRCVKRE